MRTPPLGNTIHDTSFCDAIANIYDEMVLKNFINTIAKPHVKRLTDLSQPFHILHHRSLYHE